MWFEHLRVIHLTSGKKDMIKIDGWMDGWIGRVYVRMFIVLCHFSVVNVHSELHVRFHALMLHEFLFFDRCLASVLQLYYGESMSANICSLLYTNTSFTRFSIHVLQSGSVRTHIVAGFSENLNPFFPVSFYILAIAIMCYAQ